MIDKNNRTESRRANSIDYIYEFLSDGWIAIYEYRDGLPPKPIIQACSTDKADEYIAMHEPVPAGVGRLVPK